MTPRSNKQLEILCLKLQITITLWAYLSSRVPRSLKLAGVTCWTKVSTSSVIVTWKIPNPKQVIIRNGLNYLLKKDSSFRAPPSYIHWELPCNRVIHAPVAFMQWYLSIRRTVESATPYLPLLHRVIAFSNQVNHIVLTFKISSWNVTVIHLNYFCFKKCLENGKVKCHCNKMYPLKCYCTQNMPFIYQKS